jgi:trk system potassium uptake protein TrkH
MSYARDLKIIFGNLRSLFIMVGVIMLAMAAVCMLADEPDVAPSFFYGGALGFGIGTILKLLLPENYDPELRHAMIVAALAYLVVPAISMVPFLVTQHMSPLDAFFESISGWNDDLSSNAVEVYVSRLRAKLEPSGVRIRTVRGFGYMLEEFKTPQ